MRPASPSALSTAAGSGRGTGQTQQPFLEASRLPARCRRAAVIAAVGIEVPGGGVVQLRRKNGVEPAAACRVAHRRHHLDPLSQVARSPIGGADVVLGGGGGAVGEMVDAGVLEKPAEDADDA